MKASDELRALSLPNGYTRDVIIRAAAHMDRLERENKELKEANKRENASAKG